MKYSPRQGRTLFLAYLCCAGVAVLLAAPLLSAVEPASVGASRSRIETFERADRNRDGYVDKAEAAAVRGLPARFAQADSNSDGRLDQVEYARALALLDPEGKK
jgi:hypothetical protein